MQPPAAREHGAPRTPAVKGAGGRGYGVCSRGGPASRSRPMTIGMSCRRKERMMKPTAMLLALVAALAMASAAYAQELKFEAELSGAAERPTPVVTEGVGEAKFE